MPVIVFNKRTGKYLRRHSGSYRHKWSMLQYRDGVRKEIKERFGSAISWREDVEEYNKHWSKVNNFLKDMICDAPPEDARVYATKGSATASVGVISVNTDYIYRLPSHLEIHEIKEAFVCVLRPDGSSNCDEE